MIGYEADYHDRRHANYSDRSYFDARASLAKERYFRGIASDAAVLEVGCGLGQNIAMFRNAIGYDISRFAVAACCARGIRATTCLSEIADQSSDVVLAAHVLEHHPEPLKMLCEIARKMKPGGTLIIALPYERHRRPPIGADLDQHLYSWTFQTINNLLIFAGFRVTANRYLFGTGYRKLLGLKKIDRRGYSVAVWIAGVLTNCRELLVTAELPASGGQ
jgi:SAM-dependent methyltransferase